MGFFDFLGEIPPYSDSEKMVERMNNRHRLLVDPLRGEIEGLRVLDLAAHDGRWSYALAEAGAAEVVGVEARQELIDRFALFPETEFKRRVDLRRGDIFEALEGFVEDGEEFDVVAVFGIFYHIIEHFRLLKLIRALGATVVLVDSEFSTGKTPKIDLVFERTDYTSNAAPQISGQDRAIIGLPTRKAMNKMAEALGFDIVWAEADMVFRRDTPGVGDYFRGKTRKRAFCTLFNPS